MQKNTQYQQATPLDCHTGFLSVSPAAACQGESLKPLEKFTIWRNRRHEEIRTMTGVKMRSTHIVRPICWNTDYGAYGRIKETA